MEKVKVESSNIAAIGFDELVKILVIEFHSGVEYEYYDVPKQVYEDFKVAESKGKYAHANIYKKYKYSKMD